MSSVKRTTTIVEELELEPQGADIRAARAAAGKVVSKEISYEFHIDEDGGCKVFNHVDKER